MIRCTDCRKEYLGVHKTGMCKDCRTINCPNCGKLVTKKVINQKHCITCTKKLVSKADTDYSGNEIYC